ncbi:hypothetical protein D9M69_462920 [compost metagenome]
MVVTTGIAQAEIVVDPVVDTRREREHFATGVVIIRVGGTEALVAVHIDRSVASCRDAEVNQALVIQIGSTQVQFQIIRELEVGRRRDGLAVGVAVIPEGVTVLQRACHTKGFIALLLIGPAGIELSAFFALAVDADADLLLGCEVGCLADAVDQPPRRASAIEHRSRPLDHFHPLDVGQIPEVQRIVANAVDIHVANGTETTDGDLIALTVTIGQADTRDVLQHVLHRPRPLILDDALGNHSDGLRDIS